VPCNGTTAALGKRCLLAELLQAVAKEVEPRGSLVTLQWDNVNAGDAAQDPSQQFMRLVQVCGPMIPSTSRP